MPSGEDVVKGFSKKKKKFGPPSMAMRFYYVSSVCNKVLTF